MIEVPWYVTHLAVFLLGAATCRAFTIWEGRRITEEPPVSPEPTLHESEQEYADRPRHRVPTPVALILGAAALIIGLGIQQALAQREDDQRDKADDARSQCYQEWGEDMVDTATDSRATTAKLNEARERRDDAVDSIILTIIALRAKPPEATAEDFNRVLVEFAGAKAALSKAGRQAQTAQAANPYPILDCDD